MQARARLTSFRHLPCFHRAVPTPLFASDVLHFSSQKDSTTGEVTIKSDGYLGRLAGEIRPGSGPHFSKAVCHGNSRQKKYRSVALIVLCILETIHIPVQTSYITNRRWLKSLACHVCGFAVGLNLFMIWRNVSRWSGPSLCPREEDREAVGGGGKGRVSSSRGAV